MFGGTAKSWPAGHREPADIAKEHGRTPGRDAQEITPSTPDLGTTVRQRPLASSAGGGDSYSLGYSVARACSDALLAGHARALRGGFVPPTIVHGLAFAPLISVRARIPALERHTR
jgi:hypothetical protein